MRAISQRRSAPEGRDPGPTRGGSRSRDSLIVLAANLNLRVCLLRYLFVILFSSVTPTLKMVLPPSLLSSNSRHVGQLMSVVEEPHLAERRFLSVLTQRRNSS